MILKCLLPFLLILIVNNKMLAQESFGAIINKVFFNIYSHTPDSSISYFIEKYAPNAFEPNINLKGGWTAYRNLDPEIPKIESHSIYFKAHPYFNSDYSNGEFKIYTMNFKNSSGVGISNIQIILSFNDINLADNLFEKTRIDFKNLGYEQSFQTDEFIKKIEIYSYKIVANIPSRLKIYFTKQRGMNGMYEIIFQIN